MQILCASYHSFPITMYKAKSKDSHCLNGIASGLFVCLFVTEEILYSMESALLHSSMLMADNTTWYHGGHLIKGVRPSPYSGVPNS